MASNAKVLRGASSLALLVVAIGILSFSSSFYHKGGCFHFFMEVPLIVLATILSTFALVGLFFICKNYDRCYFACIVSSMAIALALFCCLVLFLYIMAASHESAERWWHQNLVKHSDGWNGVAQCYSSTKYCIKDDEPIQSCCDIPGEGCLNDVVDNVDCLWWSREENCHYCYACRAATFFNHRSQGRSMFPTLVPLIVVAPLVVGAQIFIYRKTRRVTAGGRPAAPRAEAAVELGS